MTKAWARASLGSTEAVLGRKYYSTSSPTAVVKRASIRGATERLSIMVEGAAEQGRSITFAPSPTAHVQARRDLASHRDEVTERERRSTQAQGIAVWSAAEIGDDLDKPDSWVLVLQNTSSDVIYALVVNSTRKTWNNNAPAATKNTPAHLTMLPPGTFYLEGDPNGPHPLKLAKDLRYVRHELRPITKSSTIKVLSVTFRDAANRSWSRTDSGELTLVSS